MFISAANLLSSTGLESNSGWITLTLVALPSTALVWKSVLSILFFRRSLSWPLWQLTICLDLQSSNFRQFFFVVNSSCLETWWRWSWLEDEKWHIWVVHALRIQKHCVKAYLLGCLCYSLLKMNYSGEGYMQKQYYDKCQLLQSWKDMINGKPEDVGPLLLIGFIKEDRGCYLWFHRRTLRRDQGTCRTSAPMYGFMEGAGALINGFIKGRQLEGEREVKYSGNNEHHTAKYLWHFTRDLPPSSLGDEVGINLPLSSISEFSTDLKRIQNSNISGISEQIKPLLVGQAAAFELESKLKSACGLEIASEGYSRRQWKVLTAKWMAEHFGPRSNTAWVGQTGEHLCCTNTGCFRVCCSRCWELQAHLREKSYHSCYTDLIRESKSF